MQRQYLVNNVRNFPIAARQNKFVVINESHVATKKFEISYRVIVRFHQSTLAGIKNVRDKSRVNVRLENFFEVVFAVVVVNEKVIDARQKVVVQPFLDVPRGIFHD